MIDDVCGRLGGDYYVDVGEYSGGLSAELDCLSWADVWLNLLF